MIIQGDQFLLIGVQYLSIAKFTDPGICKTRDNHEYEIKEENHEL